MASRAPLRASPGALLAARAARGWIAPQVASLLAHASLLAASALLVPPDALFDSDELTQDMIFTPPVGPGDAWDGLTFRSHHERADCPPVLLGIVSGTGAEDPAGCTIPREILRCYPAPGSEESTSRRAEGRHPAAELLEALHAPAAASSRPDLYRPPVARLGPVRITGALEIEYETDEGPERVAGLRAIDAARDDMRDNQYRYQHCYERALLDHPGLAGRVAVRIRGEAGEDELDVEIDRRGTDVTDPALLCCFQAAALAAWLPVARGTAAARFTLTLRPGAR